MPRPFLKNIHHLACACWTEIVTFSECGKEMHRISALLYIRFSTENTITHYSCFHITDSLNCLQTNVKLPQNNQINRLTCPVVVVGAAMFAKVAVRSSISFVNRDLTLYPSDKIMQIAIANHVTILNRKQLHNYFKLPILWHYCDFHFIRK